MEDRSEPRPDGRDRAARIGCGTLLGLLLGALLVLQMLPESGFVMGAIVVASITGCIVLALRYGDAFFERAIRWLRWFH